MFSGGGGLNVVYWSGSLRLSLRVDVEASSEVDAAFVVSMLGSKVGPGDAIAAKDSGRVEMQESCGWSRTRADDSSYDMRGVAATTLFSQLMQE